MAFVWKESSNIWKGEGIYHLTFVVSDRLPMLGSLLPLEGRGADLSRHSSEGVERPDSTDGNLLPAHSKFTTRKAFVELSPLGMEISSQLQHIGDRVAGLQLCAKQIMPDHVHVVLWVKQDTGRSIRQIGNGFRIGIKRAAIQLGVWSEDKAHVLGIPFIRTLAHAGQLRRMIDYVHANPDNAWERHLNPQFYTIHRNINRAGLLFDAMGKTRLLDYPDRQVVALSRSLTSEQIETEVDKALIKAKRGCVTYTAAINDGEKEVCKAIRNAGFPLVVLLLEGFPAPGTESERFYHPSGVYHTACGEGKLLLLAPQQENYNNATLINRTEEELVRKAQQKGQPYCILPHTSQRWLMVAGNEMLKMIETE